MFNLIRRFTRKRALYKAENYLGRSVARPEDMSFPSLRREIEENGFYFNSLSRYIDSESLRLRTRIDKRGKYLFDEFDLWKKKFDIS